MKNPSFDDMFGSKNGPATDERMADFLGGFAAKPRPENKYPASLWEGMRKRMEELSDKIQGKK